MGILDALFSNGGGGLLGLPQQRPVGQAQLFGPSGNPYPGGMDPTAYALKALEPPQSNGFLFNANSGFLGDVSNALKQIADPQGVQRQQAIQNYIHLKQLGIQEKAAEEKPQVIQVDDPSTGLKRAVLVQPFGRGAQWLDIKDPAGASAPSQTPLNLPPGADVKTAREATARAAVANQEEAVKSAKAASDLQPYLDEAKAAYEEAAKVGAIGPVAGSSVRRYIDTGLAAANNALGLSGPEVTSGGAGPSTQEAARQRYDKALAAVQARITAAQNKGEGAVSNYERGLYAAQFPSLTALDPASQQAFWEHQAQENRRNIEAGKIPTLGQAPQVGAVLNRGAVTPGTATPPPPMTNQQPFPVQSQGAGGGPMRVGSKAEFDALPSGTPFIAPDGSLRRKP